MSTSYSFQTQYNTGGAPCDAYPLNESEYNGINYFDVISNLSISTSDVYNAFDQNLFSSFPRRRSLIFIPEFKRWFCSRLESVGVIPQQIELVKVLLDMKDIPQNLPAHPISEQMLSAVGIFFGFRQSYPWAGLLGWNILSAMNISLDNLSTTADVSQAMNLCKGASGRRVLTIIDCLNEVYNLGVHPCLALSFVARIKGSEFSDEFKRQLYTNEVPLNSEWNNYTNEAIECFDAASAVVAARQNQSPSMQMKKKRRYEDEGVMTPDDTDMDCFGCNKKGCFDKYCSVSVQEVSYE